MASGFLFGKKWSRVRMQRQANGNYIKQATPVLNISDEVGGWRDFGLIGFALDPQFSSNGNISCCMCGPSSLLTGGLASNGYNTATNEYFNATIGRVTRYSTTTTSGNLVAVSSVAKFCWENQSPQAYQFYMSHMAWVVWHLLRMALY
jgi:hypothetical protein